LGAAMPLVVALTAIAGADGPSVVPADTVQFRGALVSVSAVSVTLPELAKQMSDALGCEVRIEGAASGKVTLNLREVPASTLLSQAETALGGHWKILYHVSTRETASTPAPPTGMVLSLKLPSASCLAAAAVVARMAGGRLEREGNLTGEVSLVGEAIPVEEAMDTIARAAKASWRRIYVMKIDALPQTLIARGPDPADPKDDNHRPKAKPGPTPFSNHPSATGKPTKLTKRNRLNAGPKSYLPGVQPMQQPTLEEIQKQQMLGLYGTFFLFDSQTSRETAMKNFRSGLENQLKRLEALPANQRYITTMVTRQNFQRLIDDFVNLDTDQKKEAQGLYDYAKEKLSGPILKQ
jgi:hypothetical protein